MLLRTLILTFLTAMSFYAQAQIAITSYNVFSLGLSSSPERKISIEFKTFANRPLDQLHFELDAFVNFKPGPHHRFSLGLGINSDPFNFDVLNGVVLPLSLEFNPFPNLRQVGVVIELAPFYFVPVDEINIRHLLGIRYRFDRKVKEE